MPTQPPSTGGLPIIGQTLAFAKDIIQFTARGHAAHGPVFRAPILGSETYFVAGPEAVEAFYDPANIQRAGAMPPHHVKVFGAGAVNQLDGATHRTRKHQILAAVNHDAMAHYCPQDLATIRRHLAAWAAAGEVQAQQEAPKLTMALIAGDMLGIEDDETLAWLGESYDMMIEAFFGLPFDLPGFALHRAVKRKADLIERYRALIAERRATPGEDGLSRMLGAEVDGHSLDDATAATELHHLFLAGVGTFGFYVGCVGQLAREPQVAEALREVATALPAEPSAMELMHCKPLVDFVAEAKRHTPLIPMVTGKALRDFELGGMTIPAGATVAWSINPSHTLPRVSPYDDPTAFDHERFGEARAEHERHAHAWAPQGSGGPENTHHCAGQDYSGMLTVAFVVELLRGPAFTFPEQDLTMVTAGLPHIVDGLRIRFEAPEA